jgi:ubiquinone/menaquinone biosynthesis C-methylase UbiE
MMQRADAIAFKQQVAEFFNQRSQYDEESDFHPRLAAQLIESANLQPGHKVLDVATGTGLVAIAAAQQVAPDGWVVGVDLAEGMLRQARAKIEQLQLFNISLYLQDVETVNLPDDCFDRILCSSALIYLTDIPANLSRWRAALKPNAWVGFHGFAETAFVTSTVMQQVARSFGIELVLNQATRTESACRSLLQSADFSDITIHTAQLGGYLSWEQAQAGWQPDSLNPLFHPLRQLSAAQLEQAQQQFLTEMTNRLTDQGIWNDITTFFVFGRKSAETSR